MPGVDGSQLSARRLRVQSACSERAPRRTIEQDHLGDGSSGSRAGPLCRLGIRRIEEEAVSLEAMIRSLAARVGVRATTHALRRAVG